MVSFRISDFFLSHGKCVKYMYLSCRKESWRSLFQRKCFKKYGFHKRQAIYSVRKAVHMYIYLIPYNVVIHSQLLSSGVNLLKYKASGWFHKAGFLCMKKQEFSLNTFTRSIKILYIILNCYIWNVQIMSYQ